jgi:hypothetical protein
MSRKTGRAIVASCALGAVAGAGILIYTIAAGGGGAAAQALSDVGRFRVGSRLGEERAGFSGRPMVIVFASTSLPEWGTISSCLQGAEVDGFMDHFTGVLVEDAVEPEVEAVARTRDKLRVVVRGLNGAFLGGLPEEFTCADLVALLDAIKKTVPFVEKSPIYARLLESAEPVAILKEEGKGSDAQRYVDLLRDFEGAGSAAVQAAEAELRK